MLSVKIAFFLNEAYDIEPLMRTLIVIIMILPITYSNPMKIRLKYNVLKYQVEAVSILHEICTYTAHVCVRPREIKRIK